MVITDMFVRMNSDGAITHATGTQMVQRSDCTRSSSAINPEGRVSLTSAGRAELTLTSQFRNEDVEISTTPSDLSVGVEVGEEVIDLGKRATPRLRAAERDLFMPSKELEQPFVIYNCIPHIQTPDHAMRIVKALQSTGDDHIIMVIFTREACGYCHQVRDKMQELFSTIHTKQDLSSFQVMFYNCTEGLTAKTISERGRSVFPVVYVNGNLWAVPSETVVSKLEAWGKRSEDIRALARSLHVRA